MKKNKSNDSSSIFELIQNIFKRYDVRNILFAIFKKIEIGKTSDYNWKSIVKKSLI